MKAIMISIKPKWVAKILNGEKTIEIRKTCPALFRGWGKNDSLKYGCGFDVYIYCTKDNKGELHYSEQYGAFYDIYKGPEHYSENGNLNGKVVAKFTLNKIKTSDMTNCLQGSCLSYDEVNEYTKGKKFYGWVIDDLVIFDKPKELSGFKKNNATGNCWKCKLFGSGCSTCQLTKAPQSWCYLESWCYVEAE